VKADTIQKQLEIHRRMLVTARLRIAIIPSNLLGLCKVMIILNQLEWIRMSRNCIS